MIHTSETLVYTIVIYIGLYSVRHGMRYGKFGGDQFENGEIANENIICAEKNVI